MNFLVILFALAVPFVSNANQATEPVTLIQIKGTNFNSSACEYTVMEMNHWEGQTAIFINTDTGNFRIELDTESLKNGEFKSPYENVTIEMQADFLTVTVPAAEFNDVPKFVVLNLKDGDILKPLSANATHGFESLNCSFN
jgi:hypothetical protein